MNTIQLELKKHKDPHFKHVYVFHHQTRRRLFPIFLLLFLLLLASGTLLYVWQPQWWPHVYTQINALWADKNPPPALPSAPPVTLENPPETALETVPASPVPEDSGRPVLPPEIEALLAHTPPVDIALALEETPPATAEMPENIQTEVASLASVPEEIAPLEVAPVVIEHLQDVPEAQAAPPTELPGAFQVLVDEAMNHIAQGRLHTPPGDNASEIYKKLRQSAPEASVRVLDSIMFQYLQQISDVAEGGDYELAAQLYQHALNLAPEHQAIEGLRQVFAEGLMAAAENQLSRGNLFGANNSAHELYQQAEKLGISRDVLAPMQARLLSVLAEQGAEHLRRKRYTTPENNNAYDTYQLMLRLSPGHDDALNGLQQIAEKYLHMASGEIRKGNTRRALEFIERGLGVQPGDKALLALQDSLRGGEKQTLINRAIQHIAAGRLTSPAGNNAYEIYQKILQQDPHNDDAHKGLREIANTYAQMAKVEQAKGNSVEAKALLESGLRVLPDHPELVRLKTQPGYQ
jgi:tetratricopeptide (TPR) repeat protein